MQSGDYIDVEQGQYGHIDACPFCGHEHKYPQLFYNGYGPPPSYAVTCGACGAQGPTSRGRERDDHFGAREDAVRLWNQASARLSATPSQEPNP
ncbi:Lar family restriction alleviation protein [Azospirillum sp. A1-3]|uniref:Lar family restriction alleviation protein n=1 Tax=Azospirillum sp. A1-3 TaxID=185874 RepID=UPI00336BD7B1